MKRTKFKVFYEVIETGEMKSLEIIARDKYEVQNILNESFNNGILKEIKLIELIERMEV